MLFDILLWLVVFVLAFVVGGLVYRVRFLYRVCEVQQATLFDLQGTPWLGEGLRKKHGGGEDGLDYIVNSLNRCQRISTRANVPFHVALPIGVRIRVLEACAREGIAVTSLDCSEHVTEVIRQVSQLKEAYNGR